MTRISFPDLDSPPLRALAEQIALQRGSVLDLYKILLHSPPVAAGWLRYLSAIRSECSLAGSLRELVILRIAILNHAEYEAKQHTPYALREGIEAAQLDALEHWSDSSLFDPRQRAALAYTDAMTQSIQVSDSVFGAIRNLFDDREIVELTATIGAYNMVSRFLEALEIR